MVDAVDSKSTFGNKVPVRVRPTARNRTGSLQREPVRFFYTPSLCFMDDKRQGQIDWGNIIFRLKTAKILPVELPTVAMR